MNNRLADTLFRASGVVTGLRPHLWLGKLEEMQWWGAEAILEWQAGQLTTILQHAVRTVPYYGQMLQRVPQVNRHNLGSMLGQLPVLSKGDVREDFEGLQSIVRPRRRPLEHSTSGSTGQPLAMRVDRPAFARYFAAKFRALRWYGVNFADRQVRIWGFPSGRSQQLAWRLRDLLQNRLRLISFDLSAETLSRFYERCLRFHPTYMNGYTSAIWRFADFLLRSGSDGQALGMKLVVPTSEVLLDWQRAQIQRAFACQVMNEYGCAEIQAIAYECPTGHWHVTHENVIVEVLDDVGAAAPAGQPGLLTITSLCNMAMPLIRYQNGDIAVLEPDMHCTCGRHPGLPTLRRIVGRSSDTLYRTDGQPTHWTVIYYAIKEVLRPGMIVEHQARQKSLRLIELSVIRGPQYADQALARLLDRLREVLGGDMHIEVRFVEEIPRESSCKLRYFVSDIADAQVRSD